MQALVGTPAEMPAGGLRGGELETRPVSAEVTPGPKSRPRREEHEGVWSRVQGPLLTRPCTGLPAEARGLSSGWGCRGPGRETPTVPSRPAEPQASLPGGPASHRASGTPSHSRRPFQDTGGCQPGAQPGPGWTASTLLFMGPQLLCPSRLFSFFFFQRVEELRASSTCGGGAG